jgi:hypothetical protein
MHNDLIFLRHETRFNPNGSEYVVAWYKHRDSGREFYFHVW